MRRPLYAVLSVLVAASFASGHSAAQGSRSAKKARQGTGQEAGIGEACMKYRQQRLVQDGGPAHGVAQLLPRAGQVRDFVGGQLRPKGGKPDGKSANLEIPAGATESAFGYGGVRRRRLADLGVKWDCETAKTSDEPAGEIDG